MKKVYVYLFEGFSDWEISYLTPEIMKSDEYELVYFSHDGALLHSMGGLRIQPDLAMSAVDEADVSMLILPGGRAWEQHDNAGLDSLVGELNRQGKSLAAICGATVYLAQSGFFAHRKHTSNALAYMKWMLPGYEHEMNYVDVPAMTDGNVITASGIAPIEFAREVFKALGLKDEQELEKWYQLFKNGVWA